MSILPGTSRGRFGPSLLVVPATTAVVALYALPLGLGAGGLLGGAAVGLGWSALLSLLAARLSRQPHLLPAAANVLVFCAVIATGLLVASGIMYALLMNAALSTPSLTAETLSAMMQPTVPYFIIVNTLMELLIVPLVVLFNWHIPKRRTLVVIAAALYVAMRIWTYTVYAGARLDLAAGPLSAEDIERFREGLSLDFRVVLNAAAHAVFLLAAFFPADSTPDRMPTHLEAKEPGPSRRGIVPDMSR